MIIIIITVKNNKDNKNILLIMLIIITVEGSGFIGFRGLGHDWGLITVFQQTECTKCTILRAQVLL